MCGKNEDQEAEPTWPQMVLPITEAMPGTVGGRTHRILCQHATA